jgi:hypothetical protein
MSCSIGRCRQPLNRGIGSRRWVSRRRLSRPSASPRVHGTFADRPKWEYGAIFTALLAATSRRLCPRNGLAEAALDLAQPRGKGPSSACRPPMFDDRSVGCHRWYKPLSQEVSASSLQKFECVRPVSFPSTARLRPKRIVRSYRVLLKRGDRVQPPYRASQQHARSPRPSMSGGGHLHHIRVERAGKVAQRQASSARSGCIRPTSLRRAGKRTTQSYVSCPDKPLHLSHEHAGSRSRITFEKGAS